MLFASLLLLAAAAPQQPAEGFTLVPPLSDTNTYLVDLDGTTVHTWPGSGVPTYTGYLRPNGNLIRPFAPGGFSGGGIEEITWDGDTVWEWYYNTGGVELHSDIELMPNGNILMIAYEAATVQEVIDLGRDPSTIASSGWLFEHIIEVEQTGPTTGNIVWSWHMKDHLIQDFDPTKQNFGDPSANPQLVDINKPNGAVGGSGDWVHLNSIAYSPELDQIVVSSYALSEILVIDHSTTTAEAAGHTGGNSGMGGDFLYRWGNPENYGAGTSLDRRLFVQHDANWVPPGVPGEGNIVLYHNGDGRFPAHSSADEIDTGVDANGHYHLNAQGRYDPDQPVWSYSKPNPTDWYSPIMSGAIRLENGNTLITDALAGNVFEVTQSGQIVWDWVNAEPNPFLNWLYKCRRYPYFLFPDQDSLEASTGGQIRFLLEAGKARANRDYLLLASASGTDPGTPLPGGLATIPLNQDSLTNLILGSLNTPPFANFSGTLDAEGSAIATLNTFGPISAGYVGSTIHFAYALSDPWDWASNAMAVDVLP